MDFREMDPEQIFQLLETTDAKGNKVYQDVLTPLATKEQALFRNSTCPACGAANNEAFVDPDRPFISGALLPNKKLRCLSCRSEFDPYTRLVTRATPSPG
jgi:hypothetical protein